MNDSLRAAAQQATQTIKDLQSAIHNIDSEVNEIQGRLAELSLLVRPQATWVN
jgi:hypothetical protein